MSDAIFDAAGDGRDRRAPKAAAVALCLFCPAKFATFEAAAAHARTHNPENLSELKVGDVIRGRVSGESYVITAHYGDRLTAVRSVDVTQANEWILFPRETT